MHRAEDAPLLLSHRGIGRGHRGRSLVKTSLSRGVIPTAPARSAELILTAREVSWCP